MGRGKDQNGPVNELGLPSSVWQDVPTHGHFSAFFQDPHLLWGPLTQPVWPTGFQAGPQGTPPLPHLSLWGWHCPGKAIPLGTVLLKGLYSYDCHRVHSASGKLSIFTPSHPGGRPTLTSALPPHSASFSLWTVPVLVPPTTRGRRPRFLRNSPPSHSRCTPEGLDVSSVQQRPSSRSW